MNPQERRIVELEQQVMRLTDFMRTWENPALVSPQTERTIQAIVGALRLSDLDDVSGTDSASNGQVLKYNGSQWVPGTDIDT